MGSEDAPRSVWRRLLWFVGLWLAVLATVGIIAYALRLVIL